MVSSIEARYVSSIMLETLTPAGMANAMASAKSSKCHASFPSAARSFSEKSAAMPSAQAAGIRIVNDTQDVIVSRYFSKKMAQSTMRK